MFTPTYSTAQCQGLRRSYGDYIRKHGLCRLLTVIVLLAVGLIFFIFVVVPQIVRFRFRYGMSWYDLGYYGFGPSHNYVSFNEESPFLEISPAEAKCDPRYTFLAPRGDSVDSPGPMILDADGELVWSQHNWGTTQDFKVQKFKGEDYLTYWQGTEEDGHGVQGGWYMVRHMSPSITVNSHKSPACLVQIVNYFFIGNSWTQHIQSDILFLLTVLCKAICTTSKLRVTTLPSLLYTTQFQRI